VIEVGHHVRKSTVAALEHVAAEAVIDGYRDFVVDLTRVGRYQTPAVHATADLCRRLAGMGCELYVAARNPGVIDCLDRVIPARGTWLLGDSVGQLLQAVLARPA